MLHKTYLLLGGRLRGGRLRAALRGGRAALHDGVHGLLLALAQDGPVERVVVLVVHRAEQDAEQLPHKRHIY